MLAAVRIRGQVDVQQSVEDTLQQLNLPQRHACMLYPDTDSIRGMLTQAKDYITYGSISQDTLTYLLEKRGTVNNEPLPQAVDAFGFDTVETLAEHLHEDPDTFSTLRDNGLSVPFTLSPPSGGFNDTKKHVAQGGSLGKRDNLDNLLKNMA